MDKFKYTEQYVNGIKVDNTPNDLKRVLDELVESITGIATAYSRYIPLDKPYRVMADVIADDEIEFRFDTTVPQLNECACKLQVTSNSAFPPIVPAGCFQTGEYDATIGAINLFLFYKSNDKIYIVISQPVETVLVPV